MLKPKALTSKLGSLQVDVVFVHFDMKNERARVALHQQ
jgi:hypothetical protein